MRSVDHASFADSVLDADKPVLVEFWAEWCGWCRQLEPVLAAIAAERDDLEIVRINADENPVVAADYRVMGLPTMLLFDRGEPITAIVGSRSKARLVAELDSALTNREPA